MYKSIVEKVSGKNVYAGGKWLTCIGNKSVSVGDSIYTDGRCVYGFYQESQQPMVITSPKVEEVIPILARISGTTRLYCYVLKLPSMKLIEIDNVILKAQGIHMLIMPDDTSKEAFYIQKWGTLQLYNCNLDAENNFYEIICTRRNADIDHFVVITIRKNDKVVETRTFKNLRRNPYMDGYYYEDIVFARIENEYDWAIGIKIREYGGVKFTEPDIPEDPYDTVISLDEYDTDTYLITPTETIRITTDTEYRTNYKGYGDGILPDISLTQSFNIPTGVKIPAHNGYYFVINDFYEYPSVYYDVDHIDEDSIWGITINVPPLSIPHMNVTIYNANHKELLTANFPLFADFTIYKDKVLSVRQWSNLKENTKDLKIYRAGLYIITGDKDEPLTPLLVQHNYDNGDDESFNDFYRWVIYNANFKSIKNYNNWSSRIKQREVSKDDLFD